MVCDHCWCNVSPAREVPFTARGSSLGARGREASVASKKRARSARWSRGRTSVGRGGPTRTAVDLSVLPYGGRTTTGPFDGFLLATELQNLCQPAQSCA